MKRSFWIASAATLAVLVAAGGVTWWQVGSFKGAHESDTIDTSARVYVGKDLARFLIDQNTAQDITGSSIELGPIENEFESSGGYAIDDVGCGLISRSATQFPAGYRQVKGSYSEQDQWFPYISLRQEVYQFPQEQDAIELFERIYQSAQGCGEYVVSAPDGGRASNVRLSVVSLDGGTPSVVAALLIYEGYEQMHSGIVTAQMGNLITVAEVQSSDDRVDKRMVEALGSAVLKQNANAAKAKSAGH